MDGVPRSMKMGTTRSSWRYDAAACRALQSAIRDGLRCCTAPQGRLSFRRSIRRAAASISEKGSATGDYQVAPSRRSRSTSAATSSPRPHGHPQ